VSLLPSLALLGCLVAPLACGSSDSKSAQADPPRAAEAAKPEQPAPKPTAPPAAPAAERREPPLPSFDGVTLDGKPFSAGDLIGRRSLLFVFDPNAAEAPPAAQAIAHIAGLRGEDNFDVAGIAVGSTSDARAFASKYGLDFPIVDDSSGEITSHMGLRTAQGMRVPAALIGVDPDGYVVFYHGSVSPSDVPDAVAAVETQLRESLRLPPAKPGLDPTLGTRPQAPVFTAKGLYDGKPFELASLRGKPVVLIFFLSTCPHCHHALTFLREELPKLPEASRPQVIGVSVYGAADSVKQQLAEDQLDFFPVLADDDHSLRAQYGVMGGVPDIFLIDSKGAVAAHIQGWRDDRDPALARMWLAKLAGQTPPMLLHTTGYSGTEFCAVCHEQEHATWLLTPHASAFDTLVRHGAAAKPDCVGCHVVGWQKTGGFTISPPTPHLENVGCETCHGRGGPHQSPEFAKKASYEDVCVTCHDPKHSLGFNYATFLPKISHAANASLAALPLAEKQKILEKQGKLHAPLLPTAAAYVGSQACQSCHPGEFETWSKHPHANALASLEAKGAAAKPECLTCHTTAFGRPGGFPKDGKAAEHADLARVGCESCHGPGGDHVKPNAARVGTIVSLGDKCDSCVILQICGSCHDQANDPGFEFSVDKKIDAQKHGTKPPAAGLSKPSASLDAPSASWIGAIERGFALTDERG
jgi:peroxiredoxin